MKKLHLVATRFLVLNLMLFSLLASAQTPEQAQKITASYDQAYLLDLAAKSLEESTKKKAAAIEYANARNIPITYTTKEGAYAELQEVNPDGTLLYYITKNADAAKSTRVNHLNIGGSTGYNLDGQNMIAYVWDGGHPRVTHQEYDGPGGNDRFTIMDLAAEGGLSLSSHAAHVAGTIGASGFVPAAKGMAPQSKVRAYKWNDDLSEATTAAAGGMLISNHSYGPDQEQIDDSRFGSYRQVAKDWDNLMFNAPHYLMVSAAGNDGQYTHWNASPLMPGYDMISHREIAKNSLVVAATNDANVDGLGNLISVSLAPFSNPGPTDDLRIKPDIAGNGVGVYSTYQTSDDDYASINGTSMATPNITGSLLLLQQHYNNVNGTFMRAATLKGLALHTADDAGSVGPDAYFGWGLLNTKRAAETISQNGASSTIQEMELLQGQTITLQFDADGYNDLIASISWTDRAGVVNYVLNSPTPTLVNDLDIRVSKNGTTFYPWRLTSPATNSNDGDNYVDPFERVEVENASGTYTVTISHKGTLVGGSQAFSLIVTGLQAECIAATTPQDVNVNEVGGTTAFVSWPEIQGALYDLRYRKAGTSSWTTTSDFHTSNYEITGLDSYTEYEVEVRSKCPDGATSAYSTAVNFTTIGLEYCDSYSQSARADYYISNVSLNTIDHNSTESRYSDFTSVSTELVAGETYAISITTTSAGSYPTEYGVWIDYNNNGVFDSSEKVFETNIVSSFPATGSFTVPADANPLTTTMRVSIKNGYSIVEPCEEGFIGEVEDYTIQINVDGCYAFTPQGTNIHDISGTAASVSWTPIIDASYDLRYREVGTSTWTNVSDLSASTYSIAGLDYYTEYEVEVRSKCIEGAPSDYSTPVNFTTAGLDYCDSYGQVARADYYISNVSLNTINHNSIESAYSDFTSISTELVAGQTYSISLTTSASANYATSYGVWIDYNNNGVFDATERVFEHTGGASSVATGSFTVPADVNPLSTTMRVSMKTGTSIPEPCDVDTIGEVEDYTIHLQTVECVASIPQNVEIVEVNGDIASVTWTPIPGALYDLRYREVATSSWSNVLDIPSNTYDISGLNYYSEYEVEVRSKCVEGTPSSYSNTVNFNTTGLNYCDSYSSNLPLDLHISNVSLNAINNNSGASIYSDFTDVSTELVAGETYTISITLNTTLGGILPSFAVWIDYNNNGVFDATERIYAIQGTSNRITTGTFTVPSDVDPLSTTMRISMEAAQSIPEPCGTISYGEVEDYTINLQEATCTALIPQDVVVNNVAEESATVTWTSIPEMTYDLRYREVATSTWFDVLDIATNTYDVAGLNPETEYEVEVRSKCLNGTPSDYSAAVSFTTTSVEVTYCDSYANYPLANFHISNVSLNNINNTSTESGYSDFTNISTELAAGATYTISLTTGSDADYPAYYAVWIDYNNNSTFEATERVFSIATTADVVATGSFTVPSDVNPIATRMRVSLSNSPGIPEPCEIINIGEVEDYTINVVPAPACAAPTNLNLVQVTATSVIINWTAGGTESKWVVSYGTPGYTPGDSNEISLLNANSPGGQISGLSPNTQYDLYVRANCEPELSQYEGPLSFTTLSALVNDDLCDALPLTLGASSAGNAYTNVGATAQANEPQGSCAYGTIMSVWFSFEAPPSGNATVTTDIAGGSLNDTQIAIYEAPTDCSDLLTLGAEVDCDQDGGGATGHNWRSIATMTGLTAGNTYFIQVDGYGSNTGTFGIEVHDDGYDGFVYENGTWAPYDPSGVSTAADNITVIDGTTVFTTNTDVNNLTILEGATLEIHNVLSLNGDINNNGNLVFVSTDTSNGELAAVSGTSVITGNATVQRYMKNKRSYRMVSSAVTTATSIHENWQEGATSNTHNPAPGFGTHITGSTADQQNGFDGTITGNYSMFTVNVAAQQFEVVANTNVNTLTAGEGYLMFVRGDRSIDLTDPTDNLSSSTVLRATGSLVTGTKTQDFTDATANNFVMFGNPYQSAVDVNSVFAASTNLVSGFYYVYDPSLGTYGSYVTVDLSDGSNTAGSSANQYLQPGQAAQVKVSGPATLVFNESHKAPGNYTSSSANPMSENNMLTVQLYTTENFNNGGSVHDSFGIVFADGNDNRITPADATKPMNFYENLGVNHNGTYLSIEQRDMPQAGEEYSLYSAGYTQSEYTLKVIVDGLEATQFYLADHFTGMRTFLEAGVNTYNFKVESNEPMSIATDRFSIHTEQRLGVEDNNLLSGIRLFPNPLNGSVFYINAPKLNGEQLAVSISDLTGRSIYEQTLDCRANTVTVPMGDNVASGVYLVTLRHGGEAYTYRLIKE